MKKVLLSLFFISIPMFLFGADGNNEEINKIAFVLEDMNMKQLNDLIEEKKELEF